MVWSRGICECCCTAQCGEWMLALLCPCYVYASNVGKMRNRNAAGGVTGEPKCDGVLYGLTFFLTGNLVPLCMQCHNRSLIRKMYGVDENCCDDCCNTLCCQSCALVQESNQLDLPIPITNVPLVPNNMRP